MLKFFKRKLALFIVGALLCCGCSYAELPKSNLKLLAAAPKTYITFIYSKEFANRFGFDSKQAQNLAEGLLAVRYSLRKSLTQTDSEPYECYVDLFISSNMNVNYPEGGASDGDSATFHKQRAFSMNDLPAISSADQKINKEIDDAYNGLRFYFTTKHLTPYEQAHYKDDPVLLDSYRRDLMPGIAVLHFEPGCKYVAEMQQGAAVWLGKRDVEYTYKAKNSEYLYNMDSYNVLQLPISFAFQRYAKFGYCINDNVVTNIVRKSLPKLYKNYRSNPDCYKLLPKQGK